MVVVKQSSKLVSTTITKALNTEGRVMPSTLQSFLAGQGHRKKNLHKMEHQDSHSPIPTRGQNLAIYASLKSLQSYRRMQTQFSTKEWNLTKNVVMQTNLNYAIFVKSF